MDSFFWLIPLIFAIAALVYVSRSGLIRPQLGPGISAFKKMDFLLTEAERSFYEVLQRAVGEELIVFPKVRLADLVWLPKGTAGRQALLNRVLSKHVDFVICARSSLTPVVAVELDDASHSRESRRERDEVVKAVLDAAGLPILRLPPRRAYPPAAGGGMVRAQGAPRTAP